MKNHSIEVGNITYICINHKGSLIKAIIDTKYHDIVRSFKTWGNLGGYIYTNKYLGDKKYKKIYLSHVILQQTQILSKKVHVDHINLNTLDNREENLRILTCTGNLLNNKGKSVFKSGNGWVVQIGQQYKTISYGTYYTKEFAERIAKEIKEKLIKEQAALLTGGVV